jgi:2-polyprenyl-6-hydroxyphenyl methylase/3-demethylubiquinone-9 3-methyltransferase
MQTLAASVKPGEIANFDALAARWWDKTGPMRPLHMMNPVRTAWILHRVTRRFGAPDGVKMLDIGCGAGLLSESLAQAGCDVLGLDAAPAPIEAARAHAAGQGLSLRYRAGTAEEVLAEAQKFQVVTALEVIEHVTDPGAFLRTLAGLLEPGGLMFVSTLNRTPRAYLAAKLGAEYLLRLLPRGTHDWRRFVTPAELGGFCRSAGLRLADVAGMSFDPLGFTFRISRDTGINYIAMATGQPE